MPAVVLLPSDLEPFATIDPVKAQAMIDDVLARAARVAPCILLADFEFGDAAKAILRAIILRWNEAGTGAASTQSAGPFSVGFDTRQPQGPRFWPSEIDELQELCSQATGTVYTVSLAGPDPDPTIPYYLGWT